MSADADVSGPRISVLVPTWNGAADLSRLLPMLARQEVRGEVEVRAVDSSSTDATLALLEEHGVHVDVIPQQEFGHGRTRNRLAEGARGELLVFLSQDACPVDATFLRELVAPFRDPAVVGTYARILPFDEDDPLTKRTVLSAPEARDRARMQELGPGQRLDDLPLDERADRVRFNNIASAIRRAWFVAHPFPDVPFGEDVAWARATLEAGGKLAFAPRAVVCHAHRYAPRSAYDRYATDAMFHRAATGRALRPHLWSVVKGIGFEVREDWRYLKRDRSVGHGFWRLRSLALRSAQVWGQYRGGRRAAEKGS